MTGGAATGKVIALHAAVVLLLAGLYFVLPDYYRGVFPRIMVLAVFAMGYNLAFGYAGLLSLGHAMFFSAGLYGAGLPHYHLGWGVAPAFLAGLAAGALLAFSVGLLALRTAGVAFMIVTLMFAQVFYLLTLNFTTWTRGEEGLVLSRQGRMLDFAGLDFDLTDAGTRYAIALILLASVMAAMLAIMRRPFGRTLVAIRENDERVRMLGYDVRANKLAALVLSGLFSAAAGAAYALLFGYVGSGFAGIQYSILPLLYVLLGGAATVLGPLVGTFFMFYLEDVASGYTSAYLLVVGVALILLVLFFPKGILGTLRERWLKWLP